jgi:hypothetical protein
MSFLIPSLFLSGIIATSGGGPDLGHHLQQTPDSFLAQTFGAATDEAQVLEKPVSGLQQATALVRGLGIARNKGQIGYQTTLWRKIQDVIFLLRRGVPRYEAAQRAGVEARVVDQLLKWGGVAAPES